MPVVGQANVVVQIGQLSVEHPLVVVRSLITPVILGMDFLQQHGLVLDFASLPIGVNILLHPTYQPQSAARHPAHGRRGSKAKAKICAVYGTSTSELTEEVVDDCAIPHFSTTAALDYEVARCSADF